MTTSAPPKMETVFETAPLMKGRYGHDSLIQGSSRGR